MSQKMILLITTAVKTSNPTIIDVASVLGMLRCVNVGVVAVVSEAYTASIFGVEGSMYLRNVGNIAYNHKMQQPNNMSNIIKLICKCFGYPRAFMKGVTLRHVSSFIGFSIYGDSTESHKIYGG
jgi:hypothetical protein